MARNVVGGIKQLIDRTVGKEIDGLMKMGRVIRVAGNQAYVQMNGSSSIVPVELHAAVQPGDTCLLARPTAQHRWMVIGGLSRTRQPANELNPTQVGPLLPPSGFSAGSLPGVIVWQWNVPVQKAVAVEVQTNSSASEVDATISLVTRGSYLLFPAEGAHWARARCVGPNFERSGWTIWVEGTPGESVPTTRWEPLTNGDPGDPELIFADGDVVMVEVPY